MQKRVWITSINQARRSKHSVQSTQHARSSKYSARRSTRHTPPSSASRVRPRGPRAKSTIRVKKSFTLKTQLVTDGEHHIIAISEAVPDKTHDKKLSDQLQTVERLPDGCEAEADKGYQGLAEQVSQVTVTDPATGVEQHVPRLEVKTPFKKPRGKELTPEQHAFNTHLSKVPGADRTLHRLGQELGDYRHAVSLRSHDLHRHLAHSLWPRQRTNSALADR